MPELSWARGGMPKVLCAWGGYAGTLVGSGRVMPELLCAQGGVCRNFCGLKGGYAGAFGGLGGGMPELL